jgi:predicted extracellular nuclease
MPARDFVPRSLVVLFLFVSAVPHLPAAAAQSACGDPATPIHEIQGSGERTPVGGEAVTVEAVVVGDYQDPITGFSGFFLQEEDADADGDPATSEGIFVYDERNRLDVQVGDVVRAEGTPFEDTTDSSILTVLRRLDSLTVCNSGATVTPAIVVMPVIYPESWERYEGMLVTFPQALIVDENYNLGRYGELALSPEARLMTPTQVVRPGEGALTVEAANALNRIVLDDGLNVQNPDPVLYPSVGLSAADTVRSGDMVTGLTGVLDERFGVYRVQPVGPVTFTPANPRVAVPPAVGGSLRVASFNVLNYFNGDGAGGGFPTSRGADDLEEFERQRSKIVSAILALDADIVGLMEIENDGDGPESAVADLVAGLNDAAGAEVYAYVLDPVDYPLPQDGADEIKTALIYRTATVTPVELPITDLDPVFSRPPVAQTFEQIATGERLTVIVNHFKSKGCDGAQGADRDQGDGQSCFNATRVAQSQQLVNFVDELQTLTGDPDVLIIGDLNSYAKEDPIAVLESAGLGNLMAQYEGDTAYSYVYMAAAGTLDYALASGPLIDQVMGAAVWHINADEPRVLDYNEEYKSDNQIDLFFAPDMYRASDHDPVVVGFNLG